MLYLGVGPTALAYAAFFAGLATTTAAAAAVLTLVEPIPATLLAAVVLGERLTAWSTAGALVLLGTTAVLGLAQARDRARAPRSDSIPGAN